MLGQEGVRKDILRNRKGRDASLLGNSNFSENGIARDKAIMQESKDMFSSSYNTRTSLQS